MLSGRRNGSVATFGGSVSGGTSIGYSSDFVNFGVISDADFGFSFNGINPLYSISTTGVTTNLKSYSAQISGLFGANSTSATDVPEPGAFALLLGAAVPASIFAMKLRKRRK